MKLAEFGIAEANHSGLRTSKAGFSESGSGAFYETASMPVGSIAAPTVIGPTLLSRQARNMFTTSGLSLALTHGLEGQRDISRVAENEAVKAKEEGYESRSGSDNMEGASGDEQDPEQARPNKKRYHRHAPAVIQELEAFFKECPHPDEKQRQELSRRLNLATRQVKFWFQNRRTQMKAQQERHENNLLRQENERLRAENYTLREAVRNATCPTCGGPTAIEMSLEEQQIRFENARMRDELERLYALNGRLYGGKSASAGAALLSYATATPTDHVPLAVASNIGIFQNGASRDLVFGSVVPERLNFLTPLEKNMITELAVVAMEEFMKMVYASEPLWVPTPETGKDTLDFNEYLNQFPRGIGPKPDGYRSEATRETGVVMVEALSIVESFLDMNRWMELFPCIITKGDVGEVISMGTPVSRNGALQLMFAELQVPSPLVPTRQLYFLRFCKMFGDSTWAVVDVSVDNLRGDSPSAANKYRRRPSGCLIQQLPTGYSKVSWVEHSEFDDSSIHHLYRPLVMSGMAFGAHRWLSTLRRQCERQAILMANSLSSRAGGLPSEEVSRRGLLKLAQRMTAQLCNSVSASSIWTTLSGSNGEDEVRVMTRESSSDNPCEPSGMVLSAATSIWLPVSPQGVFDFLTNPSARKEWDVLSLNGPMDELVSFSKGQDPGNHVSLLRPVKGGGNMLIFQECCSDPSGSTFVYAPVDVAHMDAVMSGGDASISSVPILPSGFVIMPDGPECRPRGLLDETGRPSRVGGSLVTVAFQILVNSMPRSKLTLESINTVNTLVCNTVRNVKKTLLCEEINNINP